MKSGPSKLQEVVVLQKVIADVYFVLILYTLYADGGHFENIFYIIILVIASVSVKMSANLI